MGLISEKRGFVSEFERRREKLNKEDENFERVPHIKQEVVLFVESSVDFEFEDGKETSILKIIEILSKVLKKEYEELHGLGTVIKLREQSGV